MSATQTKYPTTRTPAPTEAPTRTPRSEPPPTGDAPTPTIAPPAPNTPLTFSPDPVHLGDGARTAAEQASHSREYADYDNGGWTTQDPSLATVAVAGNPGTWEPAGKTPPADFNGMNISYITASPATAWTTGQHVLAVNGDKGYWTGGSFAPGQAP